MVGAKTAATAASRTFTHLISSPTQHLRDRKGTTKKLCDKDFAERSGELSGAICLKTR